MRLQRLGAVLMDTDEFYQKMFRDNDIRPIARAIEIGKREGLDALVAPEWALMAGHKSSYYADQKDTIIKKLQKLSNGSEMLIFPGTIVYCNPDKSGMRNLLPVLQDGELVYAYHKRYDGGTTQFSPHSDFLAGTEPNVFEYKGCKIGVEICADQHTLANSGVNDLDLQVFVSCGIDMTTSALKPGGLFLYADGENLKNGGGAIRVNGRADAAQRTLYAKSHLKNRIDEFKVSRFGLSGARLDVYQPE